ncbi:TetR/AcrR family transcriptional regulator [Actinokineospora sp. 24-640]
MTERGGPAVAAKPTRTALQLGNRAKLLAAARSEFTERGFRETKIDAIAARAELTRGAVYSNFPSKRALYFAVLAEDAEAVAAEGGPARHTTSRAALGALARTFVTRLPMATDPAHGPSRLAADLLPEILADERTRGPYAQLMKLSAIRLGMAFEHLDGSGRRVRLAEAALTTLEGARQLAAAAPGLVEPFHVVQTCENLPDFEDGWAPPHALPHIQAVDRPWSPPTATDTAGASPAELAENGVVAILGVHRLCAIEDALRAAPDSEAVTAVVVSTAPAELFPLVRLSLAETRGLLRQAVPAAAWPRLRVVLDETGAIAAAAGVEGVGDGTEVAVRITDGRVTLRSEGWGACHATAVHEPS